MTARKTRKPAAKVKPVRPVKKKEVLPNGWTTAFDGLAEQSSIQLAAYCNATAKLITPLARRKGKHHG